MFLLVTSIPFATSACKAPAQVLVRLCPAASSMIQHSLIAGEPEWSDKIKQVAGAPHQLLDRSRQLCSLPAGPFKSPASKTSR